MLTFSHPRHCIEINFIASPMTSNITIELIQNLNEWTEFHISLLCPSLTKRWLEVILKNTGLPQMEDEKRVS